MTASEAAGTAGTSADVLLCPSCASAVTAGERYCEACGTDLGPPAPSGVSPDVAQEPTAPAVSGSSAACRECAGVVAEDGYCTQCGARAPNPRNHFSEEPASWVAAVCDRGVRHTRNEDAVALAADPEPGGHAVLVVCDGVSSSTDSDVASLAAARAAREVLAASGSPAPGTVATRVATSAKAIVAAADAANDAVIANTAPGPGNPASCTFVSAVVDGSEVVVGWVGDSRAYWLPDTAAPRLLTTDDSFAAEQIADGVPRATAENGPHAHAITRWLGVDAPDHTPRTVSLDLDAPGWLVVCSDGLWNYCSEAQDLGALVAATSRTSGGGPLRLAGALVDWANAQGGQDNVTVALARIGPEPPDAGSTQLPQPTAAGALPPTPHREEVQPDGHLRS
jgi:serine/threonine protein phosphatase PrpC